MIILMHSSKTMRVSNGSLCPSGTPALLDKAQELIDFLRTLKPAQLAKIMTISTELAARTAEQYAQWSVAQEDQSPAAATFVGDIYSGLRVDSFTTADRKHAEAHLRILSGLYGILRPFDGISPYRLEMGCRLPPGHYASLYRFWGASVAEQLPSRGRIVNLAADEFSKVVSKHVDPERLVTPKFLTVDPKTGQPKFIVVHAKIARGAFARWLITARIEDVDDVQSFAEIGYEHEPKLSTPGQPAFVCREFGGKGLSVRLT